MLALSSSLAASILAKVTVTTALALIGVRLARRSRAAVRHALLAAAFEVLLLLPIASLLAPPLSIVVPSPAALGSGATTSPPTVFVEALDSTQPGAPSPANAAAKLPIPQLSRLSVSALLLTAWLAGVTLFLLPVILGLRQVRWLRRTGLSWRQAQSLVRELALDAGIHRPVEVLLHQSLSGPMTCGVILPAIVLPPDAQNWNAEDLERAIVHELEHVRRGDWLFHCLARILCAAYWFHPLVWIAWRQLALEAERSCDDAVLARSEATAYADQLVALARRLSAIRKSPALAMANRADLRARVAAVLDTRQPRGRAGALIIAFTGAAAALIVITTSPLKIIAAPQNTESTSLPSLRKFEVASVKPCTGPRPVPEGQGGAGPDQSPNRISTPCTPLPFLIDHAYVAFAGGRFHGRTYPVKLEGLPAWANSLYQIEAKAEGTPGMGMMNGPMLQSLLEDRFALKIHSENREGRVYALTVAKGGIKLQPFQGGCTPIDWTNPPEPGRNGNGCGGTNQHRGSNVTFDGVMTLDGFASHYLDVATGLDAPVINKTGIPGYFRFHMEYASERKPGDPGYVPPTDDPPFPSIFTAVQQQLGLKLEAARGPHQVLVIDHMERPSEN